MKIVGIWLLGLFACGVTGGLVGERFETLLGGAIGASVGVALFVCFRVFAARDPARS